MKIKIVCIAKTDIPSLKEGIELYLKRIKHYTDIEFVEIPSLKDVGKYSVNEIKEKEASLLRKYIQPTDMIVLLDEKGKQYRSIEFAGYIQKKLLSGRKQFLFIIGGAYGFSSDLLGEYKDKLALSSMTYSHQMIRLLLVEQIYRAFTILQNEPYHNE